MNPAYRDETALFFGVEESQDSTPMNPAYRDETEHHGEYPRCRDLNTNESRLSG